MVSLEDFNKNADSFRWCAKRVISQSEWETNLIKFQGKEWTLSPPELHQITSKHIHTKQRGQGPLPDLIICKLSALSEEGFKLLQCWQSWPRTQGGTFHRSHCIP